jgi:Mce-associated membrane protein
MPRTHDSIVEYDIDDTSDESATEGDQAEAEEETAANTSASGRLRLLSFRSTLWIALLVLLAVAGLAGWLGYQVHRADQDTERLAAFLAVGTQASLNLTTIDWEDAEGDVQRILEASTGTFYDDFSQRSAPFIDVVKQAQSRSQGAVTSAGIESSTGTSARVLVAVRVMTTNLGSPEETPRAWRMRVDVEQVGDDLKVSNVEFVP